MMLQLALSKRLPNTSLTNLVPMWITQSKEPTQERRRRLTRIRIKAEHHQTTPTQVYTPNWETMDIFTLHQARLERFTIWIGSQNGGLEPIFLTDFILKISYPTPTLYTARFTSVTQSIFMPAKACALHCPCITAVLGMSRLRCFSHGRYCGVY